MRRKIKLLHSLLLAILVFSAPLQSFGQSAQFKSISIGDGLSQATITAVEQDDHGFMWVGTADGLNRYDGYSFVVLKNSKDSSSISSNTVTALEYAGNNSLWVGTGFGLNKINTQTLKSKSFYQWFEDSLSLSSNAVTAIETDKIGYVWVGTDNGLNKISKDESTFMRYSIEENDETSLSNNYITHILNDSKGRLWVGTKGGLNLYDPATDSFIRYRTNFEDANSISSNEINCVVEDSDGLIWIGTNYGLNKLNPDLNIISRYFKDAPKKGILNSNIINSITEDTRGQIWVGTPAGLNLFSQLDNESISFRSGNDSEESLPNDHVVKLFVDKSGLVWVGTLTAGISTINQESPQFLAVRYDGSDLYEPEQNVINSFCEIDTNLFWIGTERGIVEYDSNTDKSVFLSEKKNHVLSDLDASVKVVVRMDSVIWIGTSGSGLFEYLPESKELRQYLVSEASSSISSNSINDLVIDHGGVLWIGTSGGGLCSKEFGSELFTIYRFKGDDPSSLRDNNVNALALGDNNKLWVGTGNAGMYYLDSSDPKLRKYVPKQQTDPNRISDLFIDEQSRLWVASLGSGLFVIDENDGTEFIYNDSTGLSNNTVLAICQDLSGDIWLSTNAGLSAFDQETSTFRTYTQDGVLGKNTFRPRSSLCSLDGTLYFGGANGFDYFSSTGLRENNFVPPICITGCQLFEDTEIDTPLELAKGVREELNLDYNHSGFSLEFAALNFKQPEKNQYAYRLKGLFNQWRYIGTRRYATFSNMNPGKYEFEVIGSNNDGVWNEVPATITIVVKPAIWQTGWFRIIAAIMIFFGLYLIYRYRISVEHRRTERLELAVKERTLEIAKERDTNVMLLKEIHHRVKNNLQIIVSLLSLQSRFITSSELTRVFNEIQNRVRSMALIHEKMYKTKDLKSVNIEEYVTDLSNSLIHTYQIGQQIELDVDVEVNSFKADTLTPLGLIINEIISNALKYAFEEDKAGKIFVKIKKSHNDKYEMIIGDDGIGMPKSNLENPIDSFGTELIGALTEQLNGSLRLLESEKGTVYEIIFEDVED